MKNPFAISDRFTLEYLQYTANEFPDNTIVFLLSDTYNAVSYTHLDVYKRQVFISSESTIP